MGNSISKEIKMKLNKDSWILKKPIAHRGFHNIKSPENSIASFKNAIRMNYAIELDIHMISDGNLIVFHDNNIKRMTGINMNTTDLKLKDLERLRLHNTNEKIPILKDVLQIVNGKVPLLIEIKNTFNVHGIGERLLKHLDNYNGEYILQSFDPHIVKWFKRNAPHIIIGQISGLYRKSKLNTIKRFILRNLMFNFISRPDFVNYEIAGLNKSVIKFLRFTGFPIISWTARDYDTYCRALKLSENAVFEGFDPRENRCV